MDQFEHSDTSQTLQVTVDGQPLELPEWLADSLPSIKTYLECLAMKKERVLWSLQVDGIKVDLADPAIPVNCFSRVRANTITYEQLATHLILAGHAKIKKLQVELEVAGLVVLINDRSVTRRLWQEWEPQLQEPLFSLRALRELKLPSLLPLFDPQPSCAYSDEISLITCEIEALFQSEAADDTADLIAFSEIVDFTLIPWLKRLSDVFDQLDEYHNK
jgi:hypothetical protein